MTPGAPTPTDFAEDYDHTAPAFASHLHAVGAALRENRPLARGTRFGGFWAVTRYSDVANVLRDHRTFSPRDGVVLPGLEGAARAIPQESEPPEHTAYRAAFMAHLDRRAVERHEPAVREITGGLFDALERSERVDLMRELAVPLPLSVSSRVLGLPASDEVPLREVFLATVAAMTTGDRTALAEVLPRFQGFLGDRLRAKRASPRNDLMSTIAAPTSGFTEAEQVGLCIGFIMAGQDTTAMAIGNLLLHVASDRRLRDLLARRPDLRPGAIEETLRLFSPLQHLARTVTAETELHGSRLHRGDRIVVNLGSANRDERHFPDPDGSDPARSPNRHLGFGIGAHHCAGIHLARQELAAVLDNFLERMPLHEVVGSAARTLTMGTIYGPAELVVARPPS